VKKEEAYGENCIGEINQLAQKPMEFI